MLWNIVPIYLTFLFCSDDEGDEDDEEEDGEIVSDEVGVKGL